MESNVTLATKPAPPHTENNSASPKIERRDGKTKTQKNGEGASSDDSDIESDLVSAINYNTISSLTALKDMLQLSSEEAECGTFFQHYFLNHVNALPSRNLCTPFPFVERRRLSECREEDEDEDKKEVVTDNKNDCKGVESISGSEKSLSETSSTSSKNAVTELSGPTHKFLVSKTQLPNAPVRRRHYQQANTVHFPATEPRKPSLYSIFNRTSPLPSPHFDKRFFDSSMVEMKSLASSTSTIDNDSSEDIWVMRPDIASKNVSSFFIYYSVIIFK